LFFRITTTMTRLMNMLGLLALVLCAYTGALGWGELPVASACAAHAVSR
jgi:hypothetical protein